MLRLATNFTTCIDTLEKEKLLNIALNKIDGGWDLDKLKDIFEELQNIDIDLTLSGFEELEIDKLIREKRYEQAEYDFTDELLESHNYVVLYFDNELDWQVAMQKLGLKPIRGI